MDTNKSEKSKQMAAALQAKKQLEQRVFRMECELCVRKKVGPQKLIDTCRWVTPRAYEDILDNRITSLYCGNALCGNDIDQRKKDRYA